MPWKFVERMIELDEQRVREIGHIQDMVSI